MVFDDVKKMQAMKQLREVESGPNPPPPGTTENDAMGLISENSVVPYTETSLVAAQTRNPSNVPQSQLSSLVRKAPTMPKPKWHAPWKLYRVIAGHLGWVRCAAVEPGNEVHYTFLYPKFVK